MREALVHGGALGAAVSRYGGERRDWLDLSTGINPVPPRLPAIPPEAFTRLPERAGEAALRDAARLWFGVDGEVPVVLAPGTQALISAWPHLFGPCEAAVVSPTYGEHAQALEDAGHRVVPIADPADLPQTARLLVLCNPNNPDAARRGPRALLDLAATMASRAGLLVVDESFVDMEPDLSLGAAAARPGLLVLRSFGKVFGLAGLRLGFGLCEPRLALRLERRLGPWPVSGPAIAIGGELLADPTGRERLAARLARQSARLSEALAGAGLRVAGRTALFALVEDERAGALFEGLARRRILTRPFAERADWLRFGLTADEGEARRLSTALKETLGGIAR